MNKRVLCLLAPGFEEIETVTPIDLLRRAGAEVIVASVNGEQSRHRAKPNHSPRGCCARRRRGRKTFDPLVVPGGLGASSSSGRASGQACAEAFHQVGKMRGSDLRWPDCPERCATCWRTRSSPRIFRSMKNCRRRCRKSESCGTERVLTSRGAGTAVDFGLCFGAKRFSAAEKSERNRPGDHGVSVEGVAAASSRNAESQPVSAAERGPRRAIP